MSETKKQTEIMKKRNKMFQVCPESECGNNPVTAKTGNKEHTYCCQKGLEKTLKDFADYLKKRKPNPLTT